MSPILRRRRGDPQLNSEENILQPKSGNKLSVISKKSSRVVPSEHLVKKRTTKASKRIQEQDENIVPHIQKAIATKKINVSNRVPSLSLHPLKYDSKNKNDALGMKSPVLRDKTNSDSAKIDPSLNIVVPTAKQWATSKKHKTIVTSSDKVTSPTDSGGEYSENLQKIQISKKSEVSTPPLPEQKGLTQNDSNQGEMGLKAEKVSKTRSETATVEINKVQDDSSPKRKKFFKSGNSNKLTIPRGKESVKEAGKKRKFVKKPISNDSSLSFLVATPEKLSQSKKKTLRPRQALKNYCEESKLLLQLSPKKRNSMVVIEKLSDQNVKKLPIWKSVKFPESESKGKDVYDISDGDLSSEAPRPKKKKRTIRKPVKRFKKSIETVKTGKKTKLAKLIKAPECSEPVSKKKEDVLKLSSQIQSKPKMISMEVLDNTKKINIGQISPMSKPPKEFRPFRVTQVFHPTPMMQSNMSDHSLLSKSMSPITKPPDNINPATPWRMPTVGSFSCVRNLVQSTPQHNKITLDRPNLGSVARRSTIHSKPKMNRIEEDKSENIQEQIIPNEPKYHDSFPIKLKEQQRSKNETAQMTSSMEATVQNLPLFDDDAEDKENAEPNHQTSRKSSKKNEQRVIPVSEPQPGFSGLQRHPLREAKILRQTNLNNFLNVDDTPERTEIRTAHGIFDDMHSTPISGKPLTNINEPNIQNAFGFDDDDVDVSPIVSKNVELAALPSKEVLREKRVKLGKVKQKSAHKNLARLSTKGILNTLHQRRIVKETKDKKDAEIVSDKEAPREKEHELEKKDQEKHNLQKENVATDFSDTFDLAEEQEKQKDAHANEKESSSLPLFTDLEPPTRFVTPPKRIYKRKRAVKFSFSEGSEDEENRSEEKERMKKKAKKAVKESKKVDEWVENINKTFEEIDKFDLIVE